MKTVTVHLDTGFDLVFHVHDTFIARRWARAIDESPTTAAALLDAQRFFNFNSPSDEKHSAVNLLNQSIDIINKYEHVIDRSIGVVSDIDTLEYLQDIFKTYYLSEAVDIFKDAPAKVRRALLNLENGARRCRNIERDILPSLSLNWGKKANARIYSIEDFEEITNRFSFGTAYLQYADFGRTVEDYFLAGEEISADDFKPPECFGANFTVKFFDTSKIEADTRNSHVKNYIKQHKEFVNLAGFDIRDKRLKSGLIPVAELYTALDQADTLDQIRLSQKVIKITVE